MKTGTKSIQDVLNSKISFTSAFKILSQEGNLVYEYNPFRNYRLSLIMFEYQNRLYSIEELTDKFKFTLSINGSSITKTKDFKSYYLINSNTVWNWTLNGEPLKNLSEYPILRREGDLVDFETNELEFDINHPVDILPQYSYDGSVNLIINDGKNQPRLINSRFSPIGRNRYQIVDRKGDNDTNIYDLGELFDIDTSLYKKTNSIPRLNYYGTFPAGNLPVGHYHFYFKYMDADGNESDFIAESGLISVFIGDLPVNIYSGFRELTSYKGVSLSLDNLDSGYLYISVYYTRSTSDIYLNATVSAYKIDQKFIINSANICHIKITGFEPVDEISIDEINLLYQIASNVFTLSPSQNILFFGNITKPDIDYKELLDISLRILPICDDTKEYNISDKISEDYDTKSDYNNSYYNSKYIYNNTGYWPEEIYRFGVVYLLSDSTLSPVFNVRGYIGERTNNYEKYEWFKDEDKNDGFEHIDRNYIAYDEESFLLVSDKTKNTTENSKGVVMFNKDNNSTHRIFGVKFLFEEDHETQIIEKLLELGIKGMFFVRQKRIPTTLCLAYTIGVDKNSHVPAIPYNNEYIIESFLDLGEINSKEKQYLTHEYLNRIYKIDKDDTNLAAICPEYDVNSPYLNTLFNGDDFVINYNSPKPNNLERLYYDSRYYYVNLYLQNTEGYLEKVNIQAVEDNTKLVAINDIFFSARAGEAEEAFRYEYIKSENVVEKATNLVRGSFGPYLGLYGNILRERIINIKIPGYNITNLPEYYKIRYNDKSPYYAISDRFGLEDIKDFIDGKKVYYRGDCYICQFTHRINRNFQDPSAPINDLIVDKKCWALNYKVSDGIVKKENFDKINLGDVNAVMLGLWITFTVRSTMNLNIRSIDDSIPDEKALTGQNRSFFPNIPLSAKGVYKIPEALCYNKGFERSLSERYNFEVPDVPAIKNKFTTRISYSDIHVNDAFQNGFRTFRGTHYRDYPLTYGSITKLVEWFGDLICVFEHGVALIPVNERAVAGEGSGGNVYINTSNVLPENPKIISDTFGSLWRESIVKTPRGIYGVDTVGKKIWWTNGNDFKNISDFRVQEFLNQNISLTERELEPIIGVRNVKSHYNKYKGDVMFTFYDNLYGFEEKVWNLCWNEEQLKFITFYSWVPSYSENIYNQYFSFDRNTSKWIAKLGVSHTDNDFADGVTLKNNEIDSNNWSTELSLSNRTLPTGDDILVYITYELARDLYKNYLLFKITNPTKEDWDKWYKNEGEKPVSKLIFTGNYDDITSELYARIYETENITYYLDKPNSDDTTALTKDGYRSKLPTKETEEGIIYYTLKELYNNSGLTIYKDDQGKRLWLDKNYQINPDKIVRLLNIKANIKVVYNGLNPTLGEAYSQGFTNGIEVDAGYYQSTVAVIPKYNMQFLTTDFWKHGQAGIIDIADKIYPTYWYGKQHPFEIEFIVAPSPDLHKIFDNLEIISNNAEPESFHYEIVGDCFDFAKDKKNMYIRLEATKELYQFNGSDITFDHSYKDLISKPRMLTNETDLGLEIDDMQEYIDNKLYYFDKSTIFPLYYVRLDTINEIEDSYHLLDGSKLHKDFSALGGGEVIYYETLDEYRFVNHVKAVNMKGEGGRMRGNMHYKEDKWYVLINPFNLILRNETIDDWLNKPPFGDGTKYMVPAEYNLFSPPADAWNKDSNKGEVTLPDDWKRNIVSWNISDRRTSGLKLQEAKIKDKWMKVRIRYSGKKLAVIQAVKTLYSISYA